MTERIERVKDALGLGNDRTDAGPDADRHDVERIEGDRMSTDPMADRTVDPSADPATGRSAGERFDDLIEDRGDDRAATRHVDPSLTDPAYSDATHSDPAHSDPAYSDPAYAEQGYPEPGTADPTGTRAMDPVATGDATTWPASDSPAETGYGAPTGPASNGSAVAAGLSTAADDERWRDLQARFVDEPESVTREAGAMVDQAVARLTQTLAAAGGDGSTESLRHAFRRYREVYRTLTDV